uniref:Ran-binding protein 17 n=1 Tax=Sphaerodactylus townsendi TaxID=933632 RepID=A0ACB8GDN0_9SAUR
MNFVDYSRPSSKHRKIATSFRDTILKDILMLACSLLKEMLAKPLNLQDQQQQSLAMHLLKLVLNCLNFDFIGSSADESADDLCTVQIPTNWRSSKNDQGKWPETAAFRIWAGLQKRL